MRILGLDVGTKTVGVAVSDPLGVIATGVTTIERVGIRKDTGKVIDYIREYGCETVVIGLPLSLDGEDSVQTQKVRDFRTMLENKLRSSGPLSKVKIEWQDERYSTVEAEEVLTEPSELRLMLVPEGVVIVTEEPDELVVTFKPSKLPFSIAATMTAPNSAITIAMAIETTRLMMLMTSVGVCLVVTTPALFCFEFMTMAMIARMMPMGNRPMSEQTNAAIERPNGTLDACS